MCWSNYINYVHTSNLKQIIFKNNILTNITANRKWCQWQQYFTSLYRNTTSVHNNKKQLHPKIRNIKDSSCLYVVDNVLPILNCLSMFIFVYNSVRALGTLGLVLDLF